MHDTKERLSLFWIFAFLNYLYADVLALWEIVGSLKLTDAPHLPPWALAGSAVLMEIPMAMIVACRLLPFRANRLANIIAGAILTPGCSRWRATWRSIICAGFIRRASTSRSTSRSPTAGIAKPWRTGFRLKTTRRSITRSRPSAERRSAKRWRGCR